MKYIKYIIYYRLCNPKCISASINTFQNEPCGIYTHSRLYISKYISKSENKI